MCETINAMNGANCCADCSYILADSMNHVASGTIEFVEYEEKTDVMGDAVFDQDAEFARMIAEADQRELDAMVAKSRMDATQQVYSTVDKDANYARIFAEAKQEMHDAFLRDAELARIIAEADQEMHNAFLRDAELARIIAEADQ